MVSLGESHVREYWLGNVRNDLLAGMVVTLALIPEAIAFSIIAGCAMIGQSFIDQHALEAILVSLGAGGALLVTASESLSSRSPTVKIASKVGAGDSMVAGLVPKLAQGEDLPNCTLRRGERRRCRHHLGHRTLRQSDRR